MKLAEIIYQKSLDLPEDKAAEVIDFIDFLKSRSKKASDESSAIESSVPNEKTAALLKQSKEGYQSFADTESLFSYLDE